MRTLRFLGVAMIFSVAAIVILSGARWSAAPTAFAADQPAAIRPIGKPIAITPPLGLPPVPIPAGNPPTAETIALGRQLYYDPILSADNTISCASCHSPEAGFTDR